MPELSGRRATLEAAQALDSTNASLWLDRYYNRTAAAEEAQAKHMLLQQVASIAVPTEYARFFAGYRAAIEQQQDVRLAFARVQSRVIIGLGDKGVTETGITLHHTYGVPCIPGSALKGLASAYARLYLADEGWRAGETYHKIAFGTTEASGYITFFDALYVPGSADQNRPLTRDVITGHHPAYYVGDNPAPPADWDSPNPVPFLTARGDYLIAVAGPSDWTKTALLILGMALRDLGIGAKTAAGYGRMQLLDRDGKPIRLPPDAAVDDEDTSGSASASVANVATTEPPQVVQFRQRIALEKKNTLPNLVSELEQLAVDPQFKQALAEALIARVSELKMNTEGKKWYERLLRLREE